MEFADRGESLAIEWQGVADACLTWRDQHNL
jgi:hypothetical protein